MSGKYVSRGKYRRVSAGTPTASSESELNWNEAILGQGAAGSGSQGTGKDTDLNASELYELQRRCFSCCNVVLQQRASVENGKRMLVRTTYMNRLDWKEKKRNPKPYVPEYNRFLGTLSLLSSLADVYPEESVLPP